MRPIKALRAVLSNSEGERGVVLVTSLLVMLLLMPLGGLFLTLSLTETTIASNEVNATNTFNIAEAGLEHARRELMDVGINTTLATCTGTPCIAQINFTNGGQNVSFAGGTYSVAVQDDADDPDPTVDSNDEVIVTATGTHKNATQVIEATLGRARFQGGSIVAGDDLAISGNPTANGPYGSFHANGDLTVSGNPTVSQDLTASETYSVSGSPTVGGYEGGGRPAVAIPSVDPADYRQLADYVLKADGKVYQSDGVTEVFDTGGGNAWPSNDGGWKLSGSDWVWGGDQVDPLANSVFSIEGNAVVGANPGTPGNPWQATLLVEGFIEMSGNPVMQANSQDLLLIAGTDVYINGTLVASGIIAAHEQVSISGNPDFSFTGYVLAEDAEDTDPTAEFNYVGGNPQFTYDGTMAPLGAVSLSVLAWRQAF